MKRYRDGLRLDSVMCHRCGSGKVGVVRLEGGVRWAIHLRCGHVKTAGWIRPVEELREDGAVVAEPPRDPRAESIKKQKTEDAETERREREEFEKRSEDFASGSNTFMAG